MRTTKDLLERSEAGQLHMPVDMVVDAKSLYDVLTSAKEPSPSDEGCRLWVLWSRERLAAGAIRNCIWAPTGDMLADSLTKTLPENPQVEEVMKGFLRMRYAALRDGALLDGAKGLPPPKTQKNLEPQLFCQAYADLVNALSYFGDLAGSELWEKAISGLLRGE